MLKDCESSDDKRLKHQQQQFDLIISYSLDLNMLSETSTKYNFSNSNYYQPIYLVLVDNRNLYLV